MERRGAVRDGDGMLDAARGRNELLQLLDLRAHRQGTRLEDGTHFRQLLLPEPREG